MKYVNAQTMKETILLSLMLGLGGMRGQAQQIIPLPSLPNPPGMVWKMPEKESESDGFIKEVIANVSEPSLLAYLPERAKANGLALIIAPGGGFHTLSINSEGRDVAKWCADHGIAAFVLKYRLVPTGDDPVGEFIQKLESGQAKMDREMGPIIALAKADGLAAIQYVREHAAEFGVRPDKIGIMGFSAGGTLAAAAAFDYNESNRPNFAAPIYPALHVVDMSEIPLEPPPLFVAVTNDDNFGFHLQCIDLYQKWVAAGHSITMHLYDKGGHGFGMRVQHLETDNWIERFEEWLKARGIWE